jgi:hypothetical protein
MAALCNILHRGKKIKVLKGSARENIKIEEAVSKYKKNLYFM